MDNAKLQPMSVRKKATVALPEIKEDLLMEKLNNTIDGSPEMIKIKA